MSKQGVSPALLCPAVTASNMAQHDLYALYNLLVKQMLLSI